MDLPESAKRKSHNNLENNNFQAALAILSRWADLNGHSMVYGSGDGLGPSSCGGMHTDVANLRQGCQIWWTDTRPLGKLT